MKRMCALMMAVCAAIASGSSLAAQQPPGTEEVRAALAPLLPAGVRIETLKLEGKRSTVHGSSPSNAILSNFMRSIDSSANFERVELVQIRAEEGRMAFELLMDISCSADPEGPCLVPETGGATTGATPAKRGTIHKCRVNGALRFQDQPCAPGTESS